MVKSVAQVDSPRSLVFSILTDFGSYPEWVPGCERCSVLSAAGKISTTEIVLNSMKKITLGLRFDAEPDQLLKFEMVSGKDVKAYTGSYKLMNASEGPGTVVVTELELDAGPMAPKFMVDRMLKKTLEATGDALNKYARVVAARQPAPTAPVPERVATPVKARRAKCLLRVIRTPEGDRIWYAGQIYQATQS